MTSASRATVRAWASVLVLAAAVAAAPARADPVAVDARPVALNADDAGATAVGGLRYRGGLHLRVADERFGGFSALGISADGDRMVTISDRGVRFSARLVYDEAGNLAGIRQGDLGMLAGPGGLPLGSRDEADVESMSPGVEGEIIVAFETLHRLLRYMPGRTDPEPLPAPGELAALPPNSGIEGLTLLNDGRLLALTPGVRGRGAALGWVSSTAGWSVLTYATTEDYQLTGAATLPGGDVVVLERFFTPRGGNIVRVKRIAEATIKPGEVLKSETVAELRPPVTVDNFEGIEARRGANGETLIYLISDDNFNETQRTLLMMFELAE